MEDVKAKKGDVGYVVFPGDEVDDALAACSGYNQGYPWVRLLRDHGALKKGFTFVWSYENPLKFRLL